MNWLFEGFNMLKNVQSLQGSRKWWKFTYSGVIGNGRGKMAQQRHLERSP